jgi:hypothetical protein
MGDFQFHRTFEKVHHCGVELAAGEELESRAEGALVDKDLSGLPSRGRP